MNNFNQPYFQRPNYGYQQFQPQNFMQQPMQPQPMQQPVQTIQPIGLQGKMVESLDVVKAIDIPFDGSISVFPVIDGSAVITKQFQMDGTTKITVFKPVEDKQEQVEVPNYLTTDDFKQEMTKFDNSKLIKDLSKQIEELKEALKEKKK